MLIEPRNSFNLLKSMNKKRSLKKLSVLFRISNLTLQLLQFLKLSQSRKRLRRKQLLPSR
jgi:hypothetical protein